MNEAFHEAGWQRFLDFTIEHPQDFAAQAEFLVSIGCPARLATFPPLVVGLVSEARKRNGTSFEGVSWELIDRAAFQAMNDTVELYQGAAAEVRRRRAEESDDGGV